MSIFCLKILHRVRKHFDLLLMLWIYLQWSYQPSTNFTVLQVLPAIRKRQRKVGLRIFLNLACRQTPKSRTPSTLFLCPFVLWFERKHHVCEVTIKINQGTKASACIIYGALAELESVNSPPPLVCMEKTGSRRHFCATRGTRSTPRALRPWKAGTKGQERTSLNANTPERGMLRVSHAGERAFFGHFIWAANAQDGFKSFKTPLRRRQNLPQSLLCCL